MRHVLFLAISTALVLAPASCDRPPEAKVLTSRNLPTPEVSASSTAVAASASVPTMSSDTRTSRALEAAGFRRYGLSSGVVEYRVSGALNGRELVYFDRFGLREARYTETVLSVLGNTETSRDLTILDGAWTTSVDLARRSGSRVLDATFDQLTAARDRRDLTAIAETVLRQMGGRRIGGEVLLGQECDVWELPAVSGRTWVWKGIALRTELNGPDGRLVHEAVRLDADADVPDDVFHLPPGVAVHTSTSGSG